MIAIVEINDGQQLEVKTPFETESELRDNFYNWFMENSELEVCEDTEDTVYRMNPPPDVVYSLGIWDGNTHTGFQSVLMTNGSRYACKNVPFPDQTYLFKYTEQDQFCTYIPIENILSIVEK